jgi:hypothetical protein
VGKRQEGHEGVELRDEPINEVHGFPRPSLRLSVVA